MLLVFVDMSACKQNIHTSSIPLSISPKNYCAHGFLCRINVNVDRPVDVARYFPCLRTPRRNVNQRFLMIASKRFNARYEVEHFFFLNTRSVPFWCGKAKSFRWPCLLWWFLHFFVLPTLLCTCPLILCFVGKPQFPRDPPKYHHLVIKHGLLKNPPLKRFFSIEIRICMGISEGPAMFDYRKVYPTDHPRRNHSSPLTINYHIDAIIHAISHQINQNNHSPIMKTIASSIKWTIHHHAYPPVN